MFDCSALAQPFDPRCLCLPCRVLAVINEFGGQDAKTLAEALGPSVARTNFRLKGRAAAEFSLAFVQAQAREFDRLKARRDSENRAPPDGQNRDAGQ